MASVCEVRRYLQVRERGCIEICHHHGWARYAPQGLVDKQMCALVVAIVGDQKTFGDVRRVVWVIG